MAFETLLNKSMSEQDLVKQITLLLQSNYLKFQSQSYFLKLENTDMGLSQIAWLKSFSTNSELKSFYYDSKFLRACVLIGFYKGRYEVACQGFYWFNMFAIGLDYTTTRVEYEVRNNVETCKMLPRDVLDKGFGEISASLASAKRPKAI